MQQTSFPQKRRRCMAVSGIALLLAASAFTPAYAGDGDEAIDTRILRGILEGIGLRRDGDQTIDYRERSPLVIPSNTSQLPPPETTGGMAAANPNWPKDPDIMRAQQQAKFEKNRNLIEETDREMNPLSPSQLTPGGKPHRVSTANRASSSAGPDGFGNPLSPSELGYKGTLLGTMFGGGKGEAARFTGEPARTSLTEPPTGYQTPSPVEPYGPANASAAKATNYYGTHGELQN
jgi:hypothetical protein